MMPSSRSRTVGVDAEPVQPVVRGRAAAAPAPGRSTADLAAPRPEQRGGRGPRRAAGWKFCSAAANGSCVQIGRSASANAGPVRSRTRRWPACRPRWARPAAPGSPPAGADAGHDVVHRAVPPVDRAVVQPQLGQPRHAAGREDLVPGPRRRRSAAAAEKYRTFSSNRSKIEVIQRSPNQTRGRTPWFFSSSGRVSVACSNRAIRVSCPEPPAEQDRASSPPSATWTPAMAWDAFQ